VKENYADSKTVPASIEEKETCVHAWPQSAVSLIHRLTVT